MTGRQATILRNLVEANRAHSDHGGGVYVSTIEGAIVADNVVRGNEVGVTVGYGWGGGVFIGGVPAEMQGNVVTGNLAPGAGSGVFWDEGATGTMREDLVFANRCSPDGNAGAGLYVDGGEAPSVVALDHVTITEHRCPAPAILVEASSRLTVKGSIIWGNGGEFETLDNATYTAETSISTVSGRGNIAADPQFVDPSNADFHLRPGSPAIATAAGGTNMGAYPR